MTRRKLGKEKIRNIQKSHGTYTVSIPIDLMRELGWSERQRVTVEPYGSGKLLISDYKD